MSFVSCYLKGIKSARKNSGKKVVIHGVSFVSKSVWINSCDLWLILRKCG